MADAPRPHAVGGLRSVDYTNTFIAVAPDAEVPPRVPEPRGGRPTVASATWEMIHDAPYRWTSSDVIFTVYADRQGIAADDRAEAADAYYSVGRPCLRASDLGKKLGWGIHADGEGRLALVPHGSQEYAALAGGTAPDGTPVTVVRAMRSSRKA